MRFSLVILLLSFSFLNNAQEILFPVAKNGKWGLVNSAGKIILKDQYEYLEYFPEADKYTYDYHGKKGIIDGQGKIVSEPIFENVHLLDSNWVSTKQNGKWNLTRNSTQHLKSEYDSVIAVKKGIFLCYSEGKGHLYHGRSQLKTANDFIGGYTFKDHFIVVKNTDSSYHVFTANDLEQITANADTVIIKAFNYGEIKKAGANQLIQLKTGSVIGEPTYLNKYEFGNLFFCQKNGNYYLFNGEENRYYPVPKMNRITDYDYPLVTYHTEGKMGVWNLATNQDLIPAKYESIIAIGQQFMVRNFNRIGIISSSGRIIVPAEYESLDTYDNAYVVKKNGLSGVISLSGREIVPTGYNQIKVFDNNIKCYSDEAITIIKISNDGSINSQKTYTEYMTLSIEKERLPRRRSNNIQFGTGGRSNEPPAKGWFRPVLTRMVEDSLVEYRGKWGLKDTADSVVIRPQYEEIVRISRLGITMAYPKKPYPILPTISAEVIKRGWCHMYSRATRGIYFPPFHLVNDSTQKLVTRKAFFAIRTEDFSNYALARAFDGKPILIDISGEVIRKDLNFYGNYNDDILRICEGGQPKLSPSESPETASTTGGFIYETGSVQVEVGRNEKFLKIEDGDWFYLDKTGRQLNEIPFDFGEEFLHYRAIAKLNGKWGVIDTGMNVIVPFEFDRIKRVILNGDSYFQVSSPVNEHYLYSKKNGSLSETEISNVNHYHDGTWFAQKKGSRSWGLIDTSLKALTDFEFDYVFPFQDGHATVIIKGKKTVIDPQGNLVLPLYRSKRIAYLGHEKYGVETNRGTMVVNVSGDTLLPEQECREIVELTEHYLVYLTRGKEMRLLNFKSAAELPKKTRLISYALENDLFLLEKSGKRRLYSMKEEKYITKDLPGVLSIGDGTMIYRGQNGLLGFLNFEGDTLCQPQFKELDNLKNGWAFSRIKTQRGPVDKNGNYLFKERIFRIRPLDENFTYITKAGVGVIDPNANVIISAQYENIEVYNHHFYKAQKSNRTCDIFLKSGEKLNDKAYQDIKTIHPKVLIVKHQGFDYLYSGFLNKSLSFQNIQPISSDLYLLDENRLYGVYDASGTEIIPVRYHNILPVLDHFQVSFFNSFGYYTPKGKALVDPRG